MLDVTLSLIYMREMCGVVQRDPLHLLNEVEEWLHCHVLSFILCTVEQERRNLYVV